MIPRVIASTIAGMLLLLVGCGGAPAGPGGPGEPGGPGGPGGPGSNPFTGRLIGNGTGYIHTMDLSANGAWLEKMSVATGYDVAAMDSSQNELYIAGMNMADPMFIDVIDLTTFAGKRSFLWPDTEALLRVEGFAAAPGGRYLAASLYGFGDPFLEVMDTESGTILYTADDLFVVSNMVWTADPYLMLAYEPAGAFDPDVYGAVIAIPLEQFLEGDDELGAFIVQGFTRAQWGLSGVTYLALSADETQLAYVLNGDIWVKDLTQDGAPLQLTTGPTANVGPAFSPDGAYIAFVGRRTYGLSDTLVLPNDGTGPYIVDVGDYPNSQAYLVDKQNLVKEIMSWRP